MRSIPVSRRSMQRAGRDDPQGDRNRPVPGDPDARRRRDDRGRLSSEERQMSATVIMRENLRQMIAVLQAERQALAGLDLDAIMGCAQDKVALCGTLDEAGPFADGFSIDEECRGCSMPRGA
jgi:hypothetical protein